MKKSISGETHSIGIYLKNGGPQPTILDAEKINFFFKNNYAKVWAMNYGFMPTFKKLDGEVIHFDLITDPRSNAEEGYFLCRSIAFEYKSKVILLKDAKRFRVNHFVAKDIIGFNGNYKPEEVEILSNRINSAYASLSKDPDMIHVGLI